MNRILKKPLTELGYNFVEASYLPAGKDEYYLRNQQSGKYNEYRQLTAFEIETLVRNDNTSDDWNNILVAEAFNPALVKHCHFFGMVRIGKLESYYLEFHNFRQPVGLYNSTISSCDFGDNVVIHNVHFLSHYIIGNEVMICNVNEMATTDHAKFGNGIVKEGEPENLRIWLELCNENGGRSVMPFEGMLPGDAWLWTRNRDDEHLQSKFKTFTEKQFDKKRGYYGMVGDRCVIKNVKIIKDVMIGTDAYLKGANKIKNVTINSSESATTQIGEGCELVNGVVGYGCRVFYGVKAVRFIMASHSQLKYGARLINSYLGNNATISCCEVLNSLIFPAHEQHHNNSFLCAALVMGQSNMAAGATIGSNHNSRGADGEIIAGRGFWPGLCVSLKHNSRFASFTLIAKGNYMSEMDIPFPFSLVLNDEQHNSLKIMTGYWFLHNMYALARNSWKYVDRDKRTDKTQLIEYDYLAPDSVNEMINALSLMEIYTAKAWHEQQGTVITDEIIINYSVKGRSLLLNNPEEISRLRIYADDIENSSRKVELLKVHRTYPLFHSLITLYAMRNILSFSGSWEELLQVVQTAHLDSWSNVGGQLMPDTTLRELKEQIRNGTIDSWDALHNRYKTIGEQYAMDKLQHAIASMLEVQEKTAADFSPAYLKDCLQQSYKTQELITGNIYRSREKDYQNRFRKMTYDNEEEMDIVIGKLDDNGFIKQTAADLKTYKEQIDSLIEKWKL
jgi:hypothetical protein